MRTAVYARVSTARQAQAQTIEQQLDRLRAAVAERGWVLDEQHVMSSMSTVMTVIAAPAWAGRGWTGCGITRHWPTWMLRW